MPDITPNIAAYEARAAAGEGPRHPGWVPAGPQCEYPAGPECKYIEGTLVHVWRSMVGWSARIGGKGPGAYAFNTETAAQLYAEDLLLAAVGPLVEPLLAKAREDGARDMRDLCADVAADYGNATWAIRALPLTAEPKP